MIRRLKFVLISLVLGFALVVSGGVSVGNFQHRFEEAFDFHIAHPKDWSFSVDQESDIPGVTHSWVMSNAPLVDDPDEASFLRVGFIPDQPIEGLGELLAFAKARHPQIKNWQLIDEEEIAGVTSGDRPVGEGETKGFDYYLPQARQVVYVERHKNEAKSGAALVDLILSSISRASRPPEVKQIGYLGAEDAKAFRPGDQICYFVAVNDLKSSIEKEALKKFRLQEEDLLFQAKKVSWNAEKGRFEICQTAKGNMDSSNLKIAELTIENTREQSLSCEARGEGRIQCEGGASFAQLEVPLNNPSPDKLGPNIQSLTWNKDSRTLEVVLGDESSLGGGVILLANEKSVNIYPDQVLGGRVVVDLTEASTAGWNTVEGIAFFDINGKSTLLKKPREVDQAHNTYMLKHGGTTSLSQFPIITYLVTEVTQ